MTLHNFLFPHTYYSMTHEHNVPFIVQNYTRYGIAQTNKVDGSHLVT